MKLHNVLLASIDGDAQEEVSKLSVRGTLSLDFFLPQNHGALVQKDLARRNNGLIQAVRAAFGCLQPLYVVFPIHLQIQDKQFFLGVIYDSNLKEIKGLAEMILPCLGVMEEVFFTLATNQEFDDPLLAVELEAISGENVTEVPAMELLLASIRDKGREYQWAAFDTALRPSSSRWTHLQYVSLEIMWYVPLGTTS